MSTRWFNRRRHPAVVLPGGRPRADAPAPIPPDPLSGLTPDQRSRLPNLICIGASKCGTSALHAYLAGHPGIGTAEAKELKLFGGENWLDRLGWYASCFDAAHRVRAETSPTYTMDPAIPCVPEQMAAVLPEPRFIYLVGDPVRRVAAHIGENRALGFERRSLEEILADATDLLNPYVATSRYGHQLERYLSVFDAARILVVDQLDLRERRRETLSRIFAFAGVDPDHWAPAYELDHNVGAVKMQLTGFGRWVVDQLGPTPTSRRLARLRGVTVKPLEPVTLTDDQRKRVEDALRPDIARFRDLTDMRFEHWPI